MAANFDKPVKNVGSWNCWIKVTMATSALVTRVRLPYLIQLKVTTSCRVMLARRNVTMEIQDVSYLKMDRNVNVIGPVEMWIQHPLTHSHENMLQRFILLKHVYIEVNPQLPVLQGGLMYDPQMLKQQCICGNSSCRTEHAGKIPRVFARLQECGVSNQYLTNTSEISVASPSLEQDQKLAHCYSRPAPSPCPGFHVLIDTGFPKDVKISSVSDGTLKPHD
ncbi:histone deacetylase 7 [Silurus asotus]|uniref:Histone deacetylase 7 n=1 Tax=Silurus asotus TaxID=30991 RepID=A0AAD5AXJ2_SILAS|nr:histone deacetylase 7 [Silurus asotus]